MDSAPTYLTAIFPRALFGSAPWSVAVVSQPALAVGRGGDTGNLGLKIVNKYSSNIFLQEFQVADPPIHLSSRCCYLVERQTYANLSSNEKMN